MKLSAEAEATIAELKRFGATDIWPESGGKHMKVHYSWHGAQKYLTCAMTGSDFRGPENARTEVRHALGVVGQKPQHDKRNGAAKVAKPEIPITVKPDPFAALAKLAPPVVEPPVARTGDMQIELMTVTPEMARDWLHDNTKNRQLRETRVGFLVSAIQRGEWKLTHQPVAFDKQGVLLDGQHRLNAIVRAGIPVQMLVAKNADRASFDVIDIGDRRSLADITGLGEKEASLLRWITLLLFREAGLKSSNMVTPQQAEKVWPYIKGSVQAVLAEAPSPKRYITVTPIMAAAVIRLVGGERRQYVLPVWRDLVTMNFTDLPPVAASFLKQLLEGSVKKRIGDYQLFSRAWVTFDEDKADTERLRIDDSVDQMLEAKGTIMAAMGLTIAPMGK
jgi:hypothetical protein